MASSWSEKVKATGQGDVNLVTAELEGLSMNDTTAGTTRISSADVLKKTIKSPTKGTSSWADLADDDWSTFATKKSVTLEEKNARIAELESELETKDKQMLQLVSEITRKDARIQILKHDFAEVNIELQLRAEESAAKDDRISKMETLLEEKLRYIEDIEEQISEMERASAMAPVSASGFLISSSAQVATIPQAAVQDKDPNANNDLCDFAEEQITGDYASIQGRVSFEYPRLTVDDAGISDLELDVAEGSQVLNEGNNIDEAEPIAESNVVGQPTIPVAFRYQPCYTQSEGDAFIEDRTNLQEHAIVETPKHESIGTQCDTVQRVEVEDSTNTFGALGRDDITSIDAESEVENTALVKFPTRGFTFIKAKTENSNKPQDDISEASIVFNLPAGTITSPRQAYASRGSGSAKSNGSSPPRDQYRSIWPALNFTEDDLPALPTPKKLHEPVKPAPRLNFPWKNADKIFPKKDFSPSAPLDTGRNSNSIYTSAAWIRDSGDIGDIRSIESAKRAHLYEGPSITVYVKDEQIRGVPKYMLMAVSLKARERFTKSPYAAFFDIPESTIDINAVKYVLDWVQAMFTSRHVFSIKLTNDDVLNVKIRNAAILMGMKRYVAHFTRQYCDRIREGFPTFDTMIAIEEHTVDDEDKLFVCLVHNLAHARRINRNSTPEAMEKFLAKHARLRHAIDKLDATREPHEWIGHSLRKNIGGSLMSRSRTSIHLNITQTADRGLNTLAGPLMNLPRGTVRSNDTLTTDRGGNIPIGPLMSLPRGRLHHRLRSSKVKNDDAPAPKRSADGRRKKSREPASDNRMLSANWRSLNIVSAEDAANMPRRGA